MASMYCGVHPADSITTSCAIALSVRKIFPLAAVEEKFMYPLFHSKGLPIEFCNIVICLPDEAVSFIENFDALRKSPECRLDLPELSFQIEVPDSVIESIGIEEAKEIISKSSTLELVEG